MSALTGTGVIVRLVLRRDRVRLPVWIFAIVGFVLLFAGVLPSRFPTEADRQARAVLMESPAAQAMSGPGHGLDDYTYGAMVANELLAFPAVLVALMSIFLLIRHTRAEEETGRSELVRSSLVGRHAMTTAALTVVCAAQLLIALLLAVLLPLTVEGLSIGGSWLFALSVASVGIVFAGVAILAAQFSPYARGATGLAGGVLGAAFALRAAGDLGNGTLSWFSPIGWAQATRAYVDERWWPLLLAVTLFTLLVTVAMALSARRDVAAGLLPDRRGPARASAILVRPVGMALRLQRGPVIGWAVGLVLFGLGYGTILSEIEQFAQEDEALRAFFGADGGRTLTSAFAVMIAGLLAILASCLAIQCMLRARSEETAGRVESLLATTLPRRRWLAGYLIVALVSGALVLALAGAGMGLTGSASTDDAGWVGRMVAASLVHVPALVLTVSVAVALVGIAPKMSSLAWAVPAYGLVVAVLGGLSDLPAWLNSLSPFHHTPQVPADEFTALPLVAMSALAVVFIIVGIVGFDRRDVISA
jgi:ABC-2 type transport system permease protein